MHNKSPNHPTQTIQQQINKPKIPNPNNKHITQTLQHNYQTNLINQVQAKLKHQNKILSRKQTNRESK